MHEPIDLSPVVDSSPNTSTSKKPNNVSTSSFNSSSTTVLPSVSFKDHQKLQMFEIFGQLLGHLLLRTVGSDFTHDEDSVNRAACNLLSINLSEVCWKLILGKEVRLADLESSDPSMHGNLKILLDTEGVDDLTLYFTAGLAASNSNNNAKVGADSNTAVRVVELIPGGTDVLVTDKNKHKYVAAIIKTVIVSRLQRQSTAIRKGIIRVIPEAAFNLFSHTDLSVLLSGATEIDVEDWRTQTSYGDESVLNFRSNTVLKWFWTLVKTLTASERSLLLRYIFIYFLNS